MLLLTSAGLHSNSPHCFSQGRSQIEAKLSVHDQSLKAVFDAIRQLMQPPEPKKKRIGFITDDDKPGQTGSGSDFIAHDRPRRRTRR